MRTKEAAKILGYSPYYINKTISKRLGLQQFSDANGGFYLRSQVGQAAAQLAMNKTTPRRRVRTGGRRTAPTTSTPTNNSMPPKSQTPTGITVVGSMENIRSLIESGIPFTFRIE
jgi:hypothetical protein